MFDQESFKQVFNMSDEQVERAFKAAEGEFEDEPNFELDSENDDLSDIPSEEEIRKELRDLKEDSESLCSCSCCECSHCCECFHNCNFCDCCNCCD